MKKSFVQKFRLYLIVLAVFIVVGSIIMIAPQPSAIGFTTLDNLVAYAKITDEKIKSDTDDTIKPQFYNYYKNFIPTWRSRLQEKIIGLMTCVGLHKPPLWSPDFFKSQLSGLSTLRESKGYKGDFICKIAPTLQSKIIVFGNAQGAFHSLVRDLVKIKELGLVDASLKVTSPDHFIVFMGDVVSRSPYSMETLSLVMSLMQANPNNVLYLKGNHETADYWQEHSLKVELQIRAAHLSPETVPLTTEVDKFFNTLPLAIYISNATDTHQEFIRISDSGRGQNPLLNEHRFAKFLTTKATDKVSCLQLIEQQNEHGEQPPVDIKVIFKGEKKRETFQPHTGLRLLPSDMGSTAWTVLSCPTPVYQKALKFFYDAFVILTPAAQFDDWKITLYNRNVLENKDFTTSTLYLISGTQEGGRAPKTIAQQLTPSAPPTETTPQEHSSQETKPVPQQHPLKPAFEPIETSKKGEVA
jgi:hypothetical protein